MRYTKASAPRRQGRAPSAAVRFKNYPGRGGGPGTQTIGVGDVGPGDYKARMGSQNQRLNRPLGTREKRLAFAKRTLRIRRATGLRKRSVGQKTEREPHFGPRTETRLTPPQTANSHGGGKGGEGGGAGQTYQTRIMRGEHPQISYHTKSHLLPLSGSGSNVRTRPIRLRPF